MYKVLFILISQLVTIQLFAVNWYVGTTGVDNVGGGYGTTIGMPFATIDYASNQVSPGDSILVLAGTYYNTNYGDGDIWKNNQHTVRINNMHGAPGQYIVIRPYANDNVVLRGDADNIVRITNSTYFRFEGFEIYGEVDNITDSVMLALQFLYIDHNSGDDTLYRVPPGTPDSVVETMTFLKLNNISRPTYTDTRGIYISNCDHYDIVNNLVHHMPGTGLRIAGSDYVNVIGNEVHNCSRKSYSGTHGLVVAENSSVDGNNAVKIIVERNRVHHNYNEIYSWAPNKTFITPTIDEGKGISLQRNSIAKGWTNGRILVQNNLAYMNGLSGVHTNDGTRIDFVNNTVYMNSYYGHGNNIGISTSNGSDDITIYNNIVVAEAFGFAIAASNTTNLTVSDNVVVGVLDTDVDALDVNTIFADPEFVDTASFNFNLLSSSPAIDVANTGVSPVDDYYERTRDASPDIGAIEYFVGLPVAWLKFDVTAAGNNTVLLTWETISEINSDYFIIERSYNGINWVNVQQVRAGGNTQNLSSYRYTDQLSNNENTTVYYRLKQVDFDGSYTYSEIRVLALIEKPVSVQVFPNPVNDILHIKADDLTGYAFYSSIGQLYYQKTYSEVVDNNEDIINVENLPQGEYLLQIFTKQGNEFRKITIW